MHDCIWGWVVRAGLTKKQAVVHYGISYIPKLERRGTRLRALNDHLVVTLRVSLGPDQRLIHSQYLSIDQTQGFLQVSQDLIQHVHLGEQQLPLERSLRSKLLHSFLSGVKKVSSIPDQTAEGTKALP